MTIDYLRYLGVGDIIRIKVAHGTPCSAKWFPHEGSRGRPSPIKLVGDEYVLRVDYMGDYWHEDGLEVWALPFARCSTAKPDDAGHYVFARVTKVG